MWRPVHMKTYSQIVAFNDSLLIKSSDVYRNEKEEMRLLQLIVNNLIILNRCYRQYFGEFARLGQKFLGQVQKNWTATTNLPWIF